MTAGPATPRHAPVRAVTTALLVLLLAGLPALASCSREFGPGEGGPVVATSPEAARTKLRLQLADPCYDGDARATWTRCARWLEETAGSARTAAGAVPGDAVLVGAADGVGRGRDDFLRRGCGPTPSASADPGSCVSALTTAREQVRTLAVALGVPGA